MEGPIASAAYVVAGNGLVGHLWEERPLFFLCFHASLLGNAWAGCHFWVLGGGTPSYKQGEGAWDIQEKKREKNECYFKEGLKSHWSPEP